MDDKDLLSGNGSGWGGGMTAAATAEPTLVRANGTGYDRDSIYRSIRITAVVLYSVVCVLGVSGNGVVIWATGFRMKKTVSTVWYLSLAVADFLVTAFLPLNITYNALGYHWPFGRLLCKLDGLIFFTNYHASVYTLAVISIDRCVCVLCPVWARCSGQRTVARASCVGLAVWALSLALALSTPYFVFSNTGAIGDKIRCYDNYALAAVPDAIPPEDYPKHAFRFPAMTVARFLVGFAVPFSVMIGCYAAIHWRLRKRPLVSPRRSSGGPGRRSFRIVLSVIAAFFLCWLPIHTVWLIYSLNFTRLREGGTLALAIEFGKPVTGALCLLNSCLNPLLYLFSQGFRGVFRRNVVRVLEKAFNEEASVSTSEVPASDQPLTPHSWIAVSRRASDAESKDGPIGNQDAVTVPSDEMAV